METNVLTQKTMTVNDLVDQLTHLIIEGKLIGNEPVADSGLFSISEIDIIPTVDGQYVRLASEEYDKAQNS